jgi:hypothetical protein
MRARKRPEIGGRTAARAERFVNHSSFSPNVESEQAAADAIAWGEASSRRMKLRSFRPLPKGALRAVTTVELPSGLVSHDIAIFADRNGPQASLPSKPVLDQDGRQRSDTNSNPQYAPVAEWRSRELADRFSADVTELVRAAHPDASDGAGR